MTRVYDYFKLLFQTYKIFFMATFVDLGSRGSLDAVRGFSTSFRGAGRPTLVDQLSAQQPYGYFFCLWTLATVLSQVLPVVGTNFQGMLTDKLDRFYQTLFDAQVRNS